MFLQSCRVLLCCLFLLVISQAGSSIAWAGTFENVMKVRVVWEPIPDAVIYELVITEGGDVRSSKITSENIVFSKETSAPGAELYAPPFLPKMESLWWQVRALNLDHQPISKFTTPQKLALATMNPLSPFTTAELDKRIFAPLCPTYSWIPVLGAEAYEVQILARPLTPDNNDVSRSLIKRYKIKDPFGFDCYGENDAFIAEGTRWWRVVALDEQGQQRGEWSEALPITVIHTGITVAALGDSVTHGGGAVSNPPTDPAYDWTCQVGFPVKNLGCSGDTTLDMAARFNRDVLPFAPKILLIMGGVNDIRGGTSAADVIEHLAEIKQKCQENKVTPIFMTITPVNPAAIKRVFDQDTAVNWQREWRKVNDWVKSQPYYVDITPQLVDENGLMPSKLAADGLHADTKGKALIGQAVGEYIKKNFGLDTNKGDD